MPRPTIERPAAQPSSKRQLDRHRSILQAARSLTAEKGEDEVQMSEVASVAGAALNTVYRYFPSKVHLYAAVLHEEMERLCTQFTPRSVSTDEEAIENIMALIISATESLLSRPLLARAVMNATVASPASGGEAVARTDKALEDTLLALLGISEPTTTDTRMTYMIMVMWSGVLVSALNGRIGHEEIAPLIRLGVEQLVQVRSNR